MTLTELADVVEPPEIRVAVNQFTLMNHGHRGNQEINGGDGQSTAGEHESHPSGAIPYGLVDPEQSQCTKLAGQSRVVTFVAGATNDLRDDRLRRGQETPSIPAMNDSDQPG